MIKTHMPLSLSVYTLCLLGQSGLNPRLIMRGRLSQGVHKDFVNSKINYQSSLSLSARISEAELGKVEDSENLSFDMAKT